MITFTGNSKTETGYKYDFEGLSTDSKPTIAQYPSMMNGSSFFEMDTKKLYYYDAENAQWV